MPSFIGTLAAVLPLAAAMPRVRDAGCTSTSFGNFSFDLTDFSYYASYTFSTPAHQIDSGEVGFNLTNPATAETVACEAYSTQLEDFFFGTINYKCAAPDGSQTQTAFNYSTPSTVLNVNQTWVCDDVDSAKPTTFLAMGTIDLNLDCKESNYQNPNWTEGEIYSTRTIQCDPVAADLKPFHKSWSSVA